MELESRLETLEHEFNILKNEIQYALVEIQEQILSHYYPELRADDTPPPRKKSGGRVERGRRDSAVERTGVPERALRGAGAHMPAHPVHRFSLPADEEAWPDLDDQVVWPDDMLREQEPEVDQEPAVRKAPPQMREVSLVGVREQRPGEHSDGEGAKARPKFDRLAAWVTESVERIGKERTMQAVGTYASGGYMDGHVRTTLQQMIEMAGEDSPPAKVSTKETMDVLLKLNELLG